MARLRLTTQRRIGRENKRPKLNKIGNIRSSGMTVSVGIFFVSLGTKKVSPHSQNEQSELTNATANFHKIVVMRLLLVKNKEDGANRFVTWD